MAGMYAVYHGPQGLRRIARHVHTMTRVLADGLRRLGYRLVHDTFFDTITVETNEATVQRIHETAREQRINLRPTSTERVGVTLDETTSLRDIADLVRPCTLRHPRRTPSDLLVPPAPGVQPIPLGDRVPPVCASTRRARSLTQCGDDPARLVYDEAQRHD